QVFRFICFLQVISLTGITDQFESEKVISLLRNDRSVWSGILNKGGASSTRLATELDLQQKSVWHILYKLRYAMGRRDEPIQLSGFVEMDEAILGPHARRPTITKDDKAKLKTNLKYTLEAVFRKRERSENTNAGPRFSRERATTCRICRNEST
ncbi:MAG: hypothetical protein WC714_29495, partial [Candidatus Obscuribacterales bacterium]